MVGTTPRPGQTSEQWGSGSTSEFSMNGDAVDAKSITAIQTLDGSWQNVTNCEKVLYAVGTAHSPILFEKGYPALKYQDQQGRTVRTPFKNILSVATGGGNSNR